MRRSIHRRADTALTAKRRIMTAAVGLLVIGGMVGLAQISNAEENDPAAAGNAVNDDSPEQNNGLEILGNDCDGSQLEPHDGFQNGNRCVSTAMGEVGPAAQNPSLLITDSPFQVTEGEPFELQVSTRNLVRDRFLGAAAGGYYLESSFLNDQGLQRGHFHTACRMLESVDEAPDAAPVPAFFRATEDGGGGAAPDEVTIEVTGMPQAGIAQCAVWAGDGSHRMPMMERANQTPAFDVVRIVVREGDGQGGEEPPPEEPEQPQQPEPEPEQPEQPEPDDNEEPGQVPGGNNGGGQGDGDGQAPGNDAGGNDNGGDDQGNQGPPAPAPDEQPNDGAEAPANEAPAGEPVDEAPAQEAPADNDADVDTEPVVQDDDNDRRDATPVRDRKAESKAGEDVAENVEDLTTEPVAQDDNKDKGGLAFTGANSLAVMAGGVALVFVGLMILTSTRSTRGRKRRAGLHNR